MAKLMDALRQEHVTITKLLDVIDREVNGEALPDVNLLHEVVTYLRTYPDQYHHPKEDLIYRALSRHDPRVSPSIGDLEAEHVELADLTQDLDLVVEQARAGGCRASGQPHGPCRLVLGHLSSAYSQGGALALSRRGMNAGARGMVRPRSPGDQFNGSDFLRTCERPPTRSAEPALRLTRLRDQP